MSMQERVQAMELANRRSDARGVVGVPSPSRRSSAVQRERPSFPTDEPWDDGLPDEFVPDFPERLPLRVSEVTNGAYTAQQRKAGAHLGSDARKKRSASHSIALVGAKRTDVTKFQERLLGVGWSLVPDSRTAATRYTVPDGSCTSSCCAGSGPLGCVSKFGATPVSAVDNLFNFVRVRQVGDVETTQPRQRAFVDQETGVKDMSDVRKRGVQAAARHRLDARLEASVFFDAGAGPDGSYLFDFKLPSASGLQLPVCQNFFRTVLGYHRTDHQWRAAKKRACAAALDRAHNAQRAAAAPGLPDPDDADGAAERPDSEGLGRKGRITIAWFASFIKLYSVPMPMTKEVRIDFARMKHLHQFLRRQYVFATGLSEEAVDKYYFVKYATFRQYMAKPDRYAIIRRAVAEKVGPTHTEAGAWKLVGNVWVGNV